jgi:hypothetical protein
MNSQGLAPSPGNPGEGWVRVFARQYFTRWLFPESQTLTPALSRSTGRGSKSMAQLCLRASCIILTGRGVRSLNRYGAFGVFVCRNIW